MAIEVAETERKSAVRQAGGRRPSSLPRKRFYRARAHSNPLSDSQFPVPTSPSQVDWRSHFPAHFPPRPRASPRAAETTVRFVDVGCGFGGLLVKLSPMFPDTLILGMELRDKVSEYVRERIAALRAQNPGRYTNISVARTNAMKCLPNYFAKGQLRKMFFLFPDPHFKEKNRRRRAISTALLAEYAHVMAERGVLYSITDVGELAGSMRACLDAHPLFEEVPEEERSADPVVALLTTATEEGQRVERSHGETFAAVYRRVALRNAGSLAIDGQ